MLRRDLRRAQAAVAAAVAQTIEAAATSSRAEIAAEEPQVAPVESPTAERLESAASAPDADEPTTTRRDEPSTASTPGAQSRPQPSKGSGRRRQAASSGSRRAATPPTSRPARAPRPTGRRRVWQMTGAALAIATLVGGTAVPAIGMAAGTPATQAAASADLRTQSFTSSSKVMPEVVVSGEFSATTPEELVELQAVAAATARSGVAPIAKPGQIIIPMAAGTYSMTDGFGASRPGRSHMGQDYAASIGTPIYAAADGIVTKSQDSYGGYGVSVEIQHADDRSVSTLYAHMDYGTRAVEVGDRVVAGQFLGRVGNTGYTIGSCLHFEVHVNGTAINPVPWLESHVR